MKEITKKITKNGAEIWYVNGKRVSREKAEFEARQNRRMQRIREYSEANARSEAKQATN